MKFKIIKKNYWLFLLLLIATSLRLSGLTWAFPYSPHPDEWNIARAVSQLSLADKLNPHFFAYGQFPIYLAFFSAKIYNFIPWIHLPAININEAIFFLRFWSAIAGVGTVYLVYLISRRLFITRYSLLIAGLAAFTPGLIQTSHFGTTESLLSFFFLTIIYFSLMINEKPTVNNFLSAGLFLGLALGTKASALVFIAPFFLVFFFLIIKTRTIKRKLRIILLTIATLTLSLSLALLTSPYLLLNFQESKRILFYEMQVATGQVEVFYTRQFFNTIPVVFQFSKILPYGLGWPIFILGTFGFFVSLFFLLKCIFERKRDSLLNSYFLILTSFIVYFLSQAFLFCKWTRFMSPILAFFPIFAGVFLSYLRNLRYLRYLSYLIVVFALLPGVFFSSIYFRPDIRFTASEWIYKNIPENSKILYDTGNVMDIPVPYKNHQLPITNYQLLSVSFDFYHLDENPELYDQLIAQLESSNYIIVPSRRIFANHLRLPGKFPLTAKYYTLLFSEKLGFKQIKEFSVFPKLLSDENAEETWSVFDHPVIRIYQKSENLTKEDYKLLFKNDFI